MEKNPLAHRAVLCPPPSPALMQVRVDATQTYYPYLISIVEVAAPAVPHSDLLFLLFSASLITVTPCSQPNASLLMVTHWNTRLTKTGTGIFWLNQTLTRLTQKNSSWTAGLENPFLVICTDPVCMRECCWPCMTEVFTR